MPIFNVDLREILPLSEILKVHIVAYLVERLFLKIYLNGGFFYLLCLIFKDVDF